MLIRIPLAAAKQKNLTILRLGTARATEQEQAGGSTAAAAAAVVKDGVMGKAEVTAAMGGKPSISQEELLPAMVSVAEQHHVYVGKERRGQINERVVLQRFRGCLKPFKGWQRAGIQKVRGR